MPNIEFPKVNLSIVRKVLSIAIVLSLSFSSGYLVGIEGFRVSLSKNRFPNVTINREVPLEKKNLDFSLFWRVWDTLQVKYFDKDKLIPSEMVYGAIKGMVAAVGDPYTVFLPPEENKIVQEDLQGSFSGVGIQLGFKGTQLAVVSPLPGSPAETSGVKAGDYIIGIKDEARGIDTGTAGMNLPEAVQLIRGRAGTKVTLTLLREGVGEPLVVDITRSDINVPSVTVNYEGEGGTIAHVKLLKFSGELMVEWEDMVVELLKRPNLSGIVLDLRNNPGGFLQGAVEVASDFLEVGDVVVIEENYTKTNQEYRVDKLGRIRNQKLVVLVNKGSASSSEILAGALKDHKRAQIVGEVTFGKGTIQEPQQINGDAGLHITIARWLTPSGFWVNGVGLKPDHEIADNQDTEEDEQLLEAIKVLEGN